METIAALLVIFFFLGSHELTSDGEAVSVVGDGITDNSAVVLAANTSAGSKPIRFTGISLMGTATTITAPIVDTMEQIFSTTSQVTINNGQPIRPEWFGSAAGNIRLAVNALPDTGGVIKLENKRYQPSYIDYLGVAGTGWLAKQNVRVQGALLPEFMTDNSGLKDGSGTIINGPFSVFANGFEWDAAGVDSGVTVTDSLYGGIAQEAFDFFQTDKTNPIYATGVRIESIRGIGRSPSTTGHAVLLEAIDGGYVGLAEGSTAIHGVVIKSRRIEADILRGFNCGTDNVIIKSDYYAPMEYVSINKIYARGAGIGSSTFGVYILAATAAGSKINIGTIESSFSASGVFLASNPSSLSDVNIKEIITDTTTQGIGFYGTFRSNIGIVIARNSTNGILANGTMSANNNYVGRLEATNVTNAINGYGYIDIGKVVTDNANDNSVGRYGSR